MRRWQAAHEHRHLLSNAPAAAHSASPKASQHSTKSTTNQQPTSTPLCRRTLGSLHSEQPVKQGARTESSHKFSTATHQKQCKDAQWELVHPAIASPDYKEFTKRTTRRAAIMQAHSDILHSVGGEGDRLAETTNLIRSTHSGRALPRTNPVRLPLAL